MHALKHVERGDLDCNVVVFDGTELGELQRGYRLHDRVIRPSLVRVANNPKEH